MLLAQNAVISSREEWFHISVWASQSVWCTPRAPGPHHLRSSTHRIRRRGDEGQAGFPQADILITFFPHRIWGSLRWAGTVCRKQADQAFAFCRGVFGTVWLGLRAPFGCRIGVKCFALRSAVSENTVVGVLHTATSPRAICAPIWWVLDIFRAICWQHFFL